MFKFFRKSLSYLTFKDKLKLQVLTTLQILISFLDLIALASVGVLSGVAVANANNNQPGDRILKFLNFTHLTNSSLKMQIFFLSTFVLILFILKTLLTARINWLILRFTSTRTVKLMSDLVEKVYSRKNMINSKKSNQELIYLITNLPSSINTLISSGVSAFVDFSLCLILVSGLFYVDSIMTIFIILYFSIISFLLQYKFRVNSQNYGQIKTITNVAAGKAIADLNIIYREIFVLGRLGNLIKNIKTKLMMSANNEANIAFVPLINKYLLEVVMFISIYLLSTYKFFSSTVSNSVSSLAIFIVAITRIIPALIRIQLNIIQLKNLQGLNDKAFNLLDELSLIALEKYDEVKFSTKHSGFYPHVIFKNIEFKYAFDSNFALLIQNLEIKEGEFIALVGKSGSGKTTIVNLMLGLIQQNSGDILISGKTPNECARNWPGSVAYVPQDFNIIGGTLRENLCIGIDPQSINNHELENVLHKVDLGNFVANLSKGLDTPIGEIGNRLSGGEKQRVAIARALLSSPKLLIFDEATSALDNETESVIKKLLYELRGKTTIIMIAHRLSSITDATCIYYIDKGRISGSGTFKDLMSTNQEFRHQVKLTIQ